MPSYTDRQALPYLEFIGEIPQIFLGNLLLLLFVATRFASVFHKFDLLSIDFLLEFSRLLPHELLNRFNKLTITLA